MISLRRLHREAGETGHFGEFILALGIAIVIGGLILIAWGLQATPSVSSDSVALDAVTSGVLFIVGGVGVGVLGSFGIYSGWGRHHPRFDAGGDPDVPDVYDPRGS